MLMLALPIHQSADIVAQMYALPVLETAPAKIVVSESK